MSNYKKYETQAEFFLKVNDTAVARYDGRPLSKQLMTILCKTRATCYKYIRGEVAITYEDALRIRDHFKIEL